VPPAVVLDVLEQREWCASPAQSILFLGRIGAVRGGRDTVSYTNCGTQGWYQTVSLTARRSTIGARRLSRGQLCFWSRGLAVDGRVQVRMRCGG